MIEGFNYLRNRAIYGYENHDINNILSRRDKNNIFETDEFFTLPFHSIIEIIEFMRICEGNNISSAKKILKELSNRRAKDAPLILNVCNFPEASVDDCTYLLTQLTSSPICRRLQEVFVHNKPIDFIDDVFTAIKEGKLESVQYLVEQNQTIVNQPDRDNRTPLHHSYNNKQSNISKYLINKGAREDVLDNFKFKPSDYPIEKPKKLEKDLIKAVKNKDINSLKYHYLNKPSIVDHQFKDNVKNC